MKPIAPSPDAPDALATRASQLSRLGRDDDAEWERFNKIYRARVETVLRQVGCPEVALAEVFQEVLLTARARLPEFRRQPESFRGWLRGIARNKFREFIRRRTRETRGQLPADAEDGTGLLERLPDERETPGDEDTLDADWNLELLRKAQERVKRRTQPTTWQMFELHKLQGLTAAATARTVGRSVALVYVAAHRVQAAIKREAGRLDRGQW